MPRSNKGLVQDRLYLGALLVGTITSSAFSIYVSQYMGGTQVDPSWKQFVWLILLGPIIEELIFRGGIQRWLFQFDSLQAKSLFFSKANWLTSLLFSLAHVYSQPIWLAFSVLIPSLVFGFFRDRYGSVIPAMVLHIAYNIGFFYILQCPKH